MNGIKNFTYDMSNVGIDVNLDPENWNMLVDSYDNPLNLIRNASFAFPPSSQNSVLAAVTASGYSSVVAANLNSLLTAGIKYYVNSVSLVRKEIVISPVDTGAPRIEELAPVYKLLLDQVNLYQTGNRPLANGELNDMSPFRSAFSSVLPFFGSIQNFNNIKWFGRLIGGVQMTTSLVAVEAVDHQIITLLHGFGLNNGSIATTTVIDTTFPFIRGFFEKNYIETGLISASQMSAAETQLIFQPMQTAQFLDRFNELKGHIQSICDNALQNLPLTANLVMDVSNREIMSIDLVGSISSMDGGNFFLRLGEQTQGSNFQYYDSNIKKTVVQDLANVISFNQFRQALLKVGSIDENLDSFLSAFPDGRTISYANYSSELRFLSINDPLQSTRLYVDARRADVDINNEQVGFDADGNVRTLKTISNSVKKWCDNREILPFVSLGEVHRLQEDFSLKQEEQDPLIEGVPLDGLFDYVLMAGTTFETIGVASVIDGSQGFVATGVSSDVDLFAIHLYNVKAGLINVGIENDLVIKLTSRNDTLIDEDFLQSGTGELADYTLSLSHIIGEDFLGKGKNLSIDEISRILISQNAQGLNDIGDMMSSYMLGQRVVLDV